jgi:GNAT superfamily N-acetyltransferase
MPEERCRFQRVEAARFPLVDRFYRAQGYKVRCGSAEQVYALVDEANGIIAAARLVPQSSGHYWLRNLLVAPEWRGQGLATSLVHQFLPELNPLGCYCFALPHLVGFYAALNFTLAPSHCPEDIARTYHTYRARGRDWVLMGYIHG